VDVSPGEESSIGPPNDGNSKGAETYQFPLCLYSCVCTVVSVQLCSDGGVRTVVCKFQCVPSRRRAPAAQNVGENGRFIESFECSQRGWNARAEWTSPICDFAGNPYKSKSAIQSGCPTCGASFTAAVKLIVNDSRCPRYSEVR
jgi:hypothetical protein